MLLRQLAKRFTASASKVTPTGVQSSTLSTTPNTAPVTFSSPTDVSSRPPHRTHPLYPTRDPVWTRDVIVPRVDPIVWSTADQRTRLSPKEVAAYEERGYHIAHGVFSPKEVDELLAEARSIANAQRSSNHPRVVTEPSSGEVRSLFAVHDDFPSLVHDERVAAVARDIVGSTHEYVHQSRINFQSPIVGSGFFWHSDWETWAQEDGMPEMRAVSAVVALTDNTTLNGALLVIPGSHKHFVGTVGETPLCAWETSLKHRLTFGAPSAQTITSFVLEKGMGVTPLECKAGSVIFFDCNLLHGSANNLTPYARSNVYFAYSCAENALAADPFGGAALRRPEYLATRKYKE
uniref:Ectoine hydroxylase n=1 Tax=Sexangularia sp. CB-2014 TaxID=1486929 RepID=A0A7S1V9J6_9EUKA|mmetsp:Transcript_14492/g.45557  ORF Transcript_14492/g.45557 Transcript_14492/m.45557 type:complete len:348 (+) Transcript_14492:102-1145(+)|eukprot:CAMPEP_0170742400 /NCGR_PEP_ID=MMETSP0437-20130122/6724_1 /TAXON_ID=0 /ORGANISM="Sexangularia sp." /LENGTH=347 /DNA_ID=CAMNT_0011081019 /DNA_START=48 /DNA_END=1091 /DNA_ORIENTATION=-